MPYCCDTVLLSDGCDRSTTTSRPCTREEYRYPCCVPAFSVQSRQRCSIVCPPSQLDRCRRPSYHSELFRLFYERGDLPCTVLHRTKGQSLKWFIDNFETLNIDYYLPIFADGLCERRYPYSFIAFQGVSDLVERTSHKIDVETLSKLIRPLKRALYTNDTAVARRVLLVLQRLARGNDGALGIALVPYFSQLLPRIYILRERSLNRFTRDDRTCDMIDDDRTNASNDLLRLIDETLFVLEQCGGPDAFINIKFSVPTYEQQADVKSLTSAQMKTMVQPFAEI